MLTYLSQSFFLLVKVTCSCHNKADIPVNLKHNKADIPVNLKHNGLKKNIYFNAIDDRKKHNIIF